MYGITHTYEEKNNFFATKVIAYNYLIPAAYAPINFIQPEENDAIIKSFELIGINREALKIKTSNTIAQINIPRDITDAKNMVHKNRMAVFHGNAGVGKSAMAKALVTDLEKNADCVAITFTAEQLFSASLNEALVKAKYEADIYQIIGSPLSRKKVVFWIESFEKLIEAGYAGAFKELLVLIKGDHRLALVVTIRDYFLQKFKILYGFELPSTDIFCRVREFNDDEVSVIKDQIPEMKPLFENRKLYHLLRTPYYLDKAVRIYPQLLQVENLDEVEFKKLMWEEVVEAGSKERGTVFSAIALQRAKEMSLFTYRQPDQITSALVSDNILQVEAGELANRFAPSHDILEDWALIRYIKQQKQDAETPEALIENLDNSPAIRRAFRLWLEEFYRQQTKEADNFSSSVLLNPKVETSWKDELIIYILRSENAKPLFESLKVQLLEDNGDMLSHYIHLLRTCCRSLRTGTDNFDDLIPSGSGWDACIDFIRENISEISKLPYLEFSVISLVVDWGKQLPDFNPVILPPAAKNAALLLLAHLAKYQAHFEHYKRKFSSILIEHQAVKLLFKLTAVVQGNIEKLLNSVAALPALTDDLWTDKNFLTHIGSYMTDGVVADQVCKYFPDIIIKLVTEKWKEKDEPPRSTRIKSLLTTQQGPDYWGLDEHIEYDYQQGSAYQTPFYWLMLYHPEKATTFLLNFLNAAYEKNQAGRESGFDRRQNITLDFAEQGEKKYYGSYDYWTMFRSFNVYNRVIQSLLMGLEKYLLDLAEAGRHNFKHIQSLLKELILCSNNVSLLAVVSSVFQAYPDLLDETSAVLLGNRTIFEWDESRFSSEMSPMSGYFGNDQYLAKERQASNSLRHRVVFIRGLIGFVRHYMFFYETENLLLSKQLDGMWPQLKNKDLYWKKALTDMDARKYEFKPVDIPGYEQYVQLVPNYDPDVAQAVEAYGRESRPPKVGMVWASNVFDGKTVEDNTYAAWKSGYEYILGPKTEYSFMTSPGTMACLGIRDYLDELTIAEKNWCWSTLLAVAGDILSRRSQDFLGTGGGLFDNNAVMYGLPLLFNLSFEPEEEQQIKRLIFTLLISSIDNDPKQHLRYSIAENMWKSRPAFAMNCWYGLLKFIKNEKEDHAKRRFNPYLDIEFDTSATFDPTAPAAWEEALIAEVINKTPNPIGIIKPELDMPTHRELDAALSIIPKDTKLVTHHQFIADILALHLYFVGTLHQRHENDFEDSREVFKFFYARYLLSLSPDKAGELFTDLLCLTKESGEGADHIKVNSFIYAIVKQIIVAINHWPSATRPDQNFWSLWGKLKSWMVDNLNGYMMPLLFLDLNWGQQVDDWFLLEGKNQFFKEFIVDFGFNRINDTIDLLSGVGFKKFMPDSVSWVAGMLTTNKAQQAKTEKLEKFANRAFFNFGAVIKGNKPQTRDFLFILDFLITRGSPKSYMLKEEMIQYK